MKKNQILFLFMLVMIISCSKKTIVEDDKTSLITLKINNPMIRSDQVIDILIHDSEGNLIDEMRNIKDVNDYEFPVELESNSVFFTLVFKYQNLFNFHKIESFLINDAMNINLGNYLNRNVENETFRIEHENAFEEFNLVSSSSGSILLSQNGFKFTPLFFPPNELFYFNRKSDGSRKVINIVEPQLDQVFSLDDLVELDIKDSTEYHIDGTGEIKSTLFGKRNDIDNFFIRLHSDNKITSQLKKHYLPVGNINDYLLQTDVEKEDVGYGAYELYSGFEFNFSEPKIDISVNASNWQKMSVNSLDGDYFMTSLKNRLDLPIGELYVVEWNINGQIDQSVDFKIPNIDNYLLGEIPNYAPDSLRNISTTVFKTKEEWEYSEFVTFRSEGISLFNIPSSIEYVRLNQ